ncbi:MAG: hypothetical protein MRZ22_08370, partial [Oscillospiraceae bacterium]|nr:hypothetical protein [Oscillospiraceae bacterium]
MKEKAIDFLTFCYFGSRGNDIDSIINRAYVDMASHTMATFEDVNEKWSCRWNASNVIKEAIVTIDKPYDTWHNDTCNNIISQYPENVLSYGQAQKWLNMTVKYVYVLKLLDRFQGQYKYISDEHVSEFHVPIDSYILENVLCDKHTVWSKMNYLQYKKIREELAQKSYEFLDELQEWDELVIGT